MARFTCVLSGELADRDKVGAVKRIFRNQKIVVVLCSMFLLTLSGCVTSEERKELDKLEVELDDAINDLEKSLEDVDLDDAITDLEKSLEDVDLDDAITDLEKSLEDFETWNSCMEMYDYDPPEGMCE